MKRSDILLNFFRKTYGDSCKYVRRDIDYIDNEFVYSYITINTFDNMIFLTHENFGNNIRTNDVLYKSYEIPKILRNYTIENILI